MRSESSDLPRGLDVESEDEYSKVVAPVPEQLHGEWDVPVGDRRVCVEVKIGGDGAQLRVESQSESLPVRPSVLLALFIRSTLANDDPETWWVEISKESYQDLKQQGWGIGRSYQQRTKDNDIKAIRGVFRKLVGTSVGPLKNGYGKYRLVHRAKSGNAPTKLPPSKFEGRPIALRSDSGERLGSAYDLGNGCAVTVAAVVASKLCGPRSVVGEPELGLAILGGSSGGDVPTPSVRLYWATLRTTTYYAQYVDQNDVPREVCLTLNEVPPGRPATVPCSVLSDVAPELIRGAAVLFDKRADLEPTISTPALRLVGLLDREGSSWVVRMLPAALRRSGLGPRMGVHVAASRRSAASVRGLDDRCKEILRRSVNLPDCLSRIGAPADGAGLAHWLGELSANQAATHIQHTVEELEKHPSAETAAVLAHAWAELLLVLLSLDCGALDVLPPHQERHGRVSSATDAPTAECRMAYRDGRREPTLDLQLRPTSRKRPDGTDEAIEVLKQPEHYIEVNADLLPPLSPSAADAAKMVGAELATKMQRHCLRAWVGRQPALQVTDDLDGLFGQGGDLLELAREDSVTYYGLVRAPVASNSRETLQRRNALLGALEQMVARLQARLSTTSRPDSRPRDDSVLQILWSEVNADEQSEENRLLLRLHKIANSLKTIDARDRRKQHQERR